MTVIAWDGKTLAADKQCTTCGHATTVTKIHRVVGGIVGLAGGESHLMAMLDWFQLGQPKGAFPEPPPDESEGDALFISNLGEVRLYGGKGRGFSAVRLDRSAAMGCGRDYALAAMHLGHDARTAVEVACALDVNCGMGIDTLQLETE